MNYAWTIVGGGIHGVHIAARLRAEFGVPVDKLCIVDPRERLLESWRRNTETTGMAYLRSPSVHNLDIGPFSLHRFAGKVKSRGKSVFASPYNRPALDVFNAHCDQVIQDHGLDTCHLCDRVDAISLGCDSIELRTRKGETFQSGLLVLAIGASEQLQWPYWAPDDDPRVQHMFQPGFSRENMEISGREVAIVGGGISAAQLAVKLANQGAKVHLIARHAPRKHQFDSDPGWLGPKYMTGFRRERDWQRRREIISEARHRGSMPPEVFRALRHKMRKEAVIWQEDTVRDLRLQGDSLFLSLKSGGALAVDRVILATGFDTQRPGGEMLDRLIEAAELPCAPCGYPIVDSSLRWHPKIHVSGPLAELELGPTSRNIAGARNAADRIVALP